MQPNKCKGDGQLLRQPEAKVYVQDGRNNADNVRGWCFLGM